MSFGPDLFNFLEDLRANNTRDWFLANKRRYETAVKNPAMALIEELRPRVQALSAVHDAGSLTRPHRDATRS